MDFGQYGRRGTDSHETLLLVSQIVPSRMTRVRSEPISSRSESCDSECLPIAITRFVTPRAGSKRYPHNKRRMARQ